jgi:hypothetical protein
VITQANSIHTMRASGNGVAALGLVAMHQGVQHSKPQPKLQSQPKSLRGSSFIASLLHTTAMFWACEYEDYRSPGGASA